MITSTADLHRELAVLERRLQDGERRIEEAANAGADTADWDEFWVRLLYRYEDVYRQLHSDGRGEGRAP